MIQNINLFSALPQKPKEYVSSEALLVILLLFVTLLITLYFFSYIPMLKDRDSLEKLLIDKNAISEQIDSIAKIKITNPTKKGVSKQKMPKFSPLFESLGQASVDGLWLVNIQFSFVNNSFNLNGYASDFNIIPVWLKSLSNAEHFPKGKISILNFRKTDEEQGSVYFKIGREYESKISAFHFNKMFAFLFDIYLL